MSAGIRAGSNNDGYVQVNGNDIITALSGGNVGIGTSSPSTKLHVNGTITATSFSGGVPITSGSSWRVVTSSSANALKGEQNLQFDGTDLYISDFIKHKDDADTKIGFPAADQIQFDTGGTNYLKLHRYASVNFVEVGATANISFADNAANGRSILIGDANASSTGSLHLQAGGGSTGFGGGIRLYSHANSTNAGGVYIGKSLNSSGSIILGNGGTTPSHEYLKITSTGKSLFKSQGDNAVWISLLDHDSSNEIWRVGQASDGDGYVEVLEDGGTVGCRLDASGNSFTMNKFGVGIASPGAKLHVDSGSSYSVGTFNSAHANGILINLQRGGTNTGFIGSGKNIADATGGVDDVGMRSQANLIFTSGGGTERLRITSGGQIFVGGNTTYNESSSLISFATDAAAGANMLSDSSPIYNHNNPAFIHIQNRYNTGTGQEAGIILHSKSSYNGSWAIYSKRTSTNYLADLIFRNRSGQNASAERMRISDNGDVIIGNISNDLTSHAGSSRRLAVVDTGNGALLHLRGQSPSIFLDCSSGGTGSIYMDGHDFKIFSGTPAASVATRFNITSDGDVLIGTTTTAGKLTVDSGTSNTCATFQSSDAGAGINLKDNHARSSIEQNGTTLKISADTGAEHANSDIRLQVDGSTKMLIDHNGNIKMGTTGSYKAGERILIQKSAGYNDGVVAITQDDSTVTERRFLYFFNDQGGVAGSVRHTGATACQYHTSSDYRLKENVVDITDGISRIKQLKPKRFNFKTEPGETVDGFLAHEVSPVIPDAVSGDKDGEVMQSLGYERLTPLLTAALKEAIAKIETLEAKVAALESS